MVPHTDESFPNHVLSSPSVPVVHNTVGEERKKEAYKEKAASVRSYVTRMIQHTSEKANTAEVRALWPRHSFIRKALRVYQANRGKTTIPRHEKEIVELGPGFFELASKQGPFNPPPGSMLLTSVRLKLRSYFSHTICASVSPLWHSGKLSYELNHLNINAMAGRTLPTVLLVDLVSLDEEVCSVDHGYLCGCQSCYLLRTDTSTHPDMIGQWGCLERRDIFQMELFKVGNLPHAEDLKAFVHSWLENTATGRTLLHPQRLPRVLRGQLELFGRIQLGKSLYIRVRSDIHTAIPVRVVLSAPPGPGGEDKTGSFSLTSQVYAQIRKPYRLFLRRLQLRLYLLHQSYVARILQNFNRQLYNILPLVRERKATQPPRPPPPLNQEEEELDLSSATASESGGESPGEGGISGDRLRKHAHQFLSSVPLPPLSMSSLYNGIRDEESHVEGKRGKGGREFSPAEEKSNGSNSTYYDSNESDSLGEDWLPFRWTTISLVHRPRQESDSSSSSSSSEVPTDDTASESLLLENHLWEQQVQEAEAELSPLESD